MKHKTLIAFASALFGMSTSAFAGTTYQATGPVLELTDSKIVIQKDKEKWEIARTPDTKVTGDLKVGGKVTIQYTMSATSIESKTVKPAVLMPKAPAIPANPGMPAKPKVP